MGDPRPVLGLREGFLGEVMLALSRWMNRRWLEGDEAERALGEGCQIQAERGARNTQVHRG